MPENQQYSSISSAKNVLSVSRFIKEFAKEENITLKGNSGGELELILGQVDNVLTELETKHKDWIDEKRGNLSTYLSTISEKTLRDGYERGLAMFLRQQYRLFKGISPEETNKLHDKTYLSDAISAYTYDFYLTLRTAERTGAAPTIALRLATLSFRHNPNAFKELEEEFPDFNPGNFRYALVNNSTDPKGYLREVDEKTKDLAKKYPHFTLVDIREAAMGHPIDTEGFLKKVDEQSAALTIQYPKIPPWAIRHAVMTYSDSKSFIAEAEKKYEDLLVKFPEFQATQIRMVVYLRRKDSEQFLEQARRKFSNLNKAFADFSDSQLRWAVINTASPEAYLLNVREQTTMLLELFPEFSLAEIKQVFFISSNPKETLERYKSTIQQLSTEFSDFPTWVIRTTVMDTNQPEIFLSNLREQRMSLKEKFPELSDSAILNAIKGHPSNPDLFLENVIEQTKSLIEEYPEIPPSYIHWAVINHKEANDFLMKASAMADELVKTTTGFTRSEILIAVFLHPSNPQLTIEKWQMKEKELAVPYSDFSPREIRQVVIKNKNPANFLSTTRKTIQSLTENYHNVPKWIIRLLALQSGANAEIKLVQVEREKDMLLKKFPNATNTDLYNTILNRGNGVENILYENNN